MLTSWWKCWKEHLGDGGERERDETGGGAFVPVVPTSWHGHELSVTEGSKAGDGKIDQQQP